MPELGLRSHEPIATATLVTVIFVCIALIFIWFLLKNRAAKLDSRAVKHKRFPVGDHCYLISVEIEGTLYTLYESPRGLVLLSSLNTEQH